MNRTSFQAQYRKKLKKQKDKLHREKQKMQTSLKPRVVEVIQNNSLDQLVEGNRQKIKRTVYRRWRIECCGSWRSRCCRWYRAGSIN